MCIDVLGIIYIQTAVLEELITLNPKADKRRWNRCCQNGSLSLENGLMMFIWLMVNSTRSFVKEMVRGCGFPGYINSTNTVKVVIKLEETKEPAIPWTMEKHFSVVKGTIT